MDNQSIRARMMSLRQNLGIEQKISMDQRIAESVFHYCDKYTSIGLYCSYQKEVDTYGLMETWFWDEKIISVPKVNHDVIDFYPIKGFEELQEGAFGILEPTSTLAVLKEEIEVMLIPLLAFNEQKFRIGYGKGYYDRYLHDFKGLKIGLAYAFQYENEISIREGEFPCDAIITDQDVWV